MSSKPEHLFTIGIPLWLIDVSSLWPDGQEPAMPAHVDAEVVRKRIIELGGWLALAHESGLLDGIDEDLEVTPEWKAEDAN